MLCCPNEVIEQISFRCPWSGLLYRTSNPVYHMGPWPNSKQQRCFIVNMNYTLYLPMLIIRAVCFKSPTCLNESHYRHIYIQGCQLQYDSGSLGANFFMKLSSLFEMSLYAKRNQFQQSNQTWTRLQKEDITVVVFLFVGVRSSSYICRS